MEEVLEYLSENIKDEIIKALNKNIQGIEEITYKGEPIKLGTIKRMCDNANDYMDAICISLDTCGMKINELVKAVKQSDKKINKED